MTQHEGPGPLPPGCDWFIYHNVIDYWSGKERGCSADEAAALWMTTEYERGRQLIHSGDYHLLSQALFRHTLSEREAGELREREVREFFRRRRERILAIIHQLEA